MKKPTPTINPQELLNTEQAAKYVHRSESTLKRLRKSGQLRSYTCGERGRGNFYRKEDLDALFVPEDARLDAVVEEVVSQAPALTPERKSRLRELLS